MGLGILNGSEHGLILGLFILLFIGVLKMNKLLMIEKYRKMGWSIIPLRPHDKKPLIPWTEYQKRHATDDEIKEWFDGTDNNIGIVTGSLSNLGVIDADGPIGLSTLQKANLASPFTVLTGNGKQLYFRLGDINNTSKTLGEGIDTRGEGGYVVGVPSVHPNGMPYRWANGQLPNIAQLPDWPKDGLENRPLVQVAKQIQQDSIVDLLSHGVKGMEPRHPVLVKLACYLVPRNTYTMTLHLLLEWNKLNDRPYPTEEIEKQIKDISKRYERGTYTSTYKALPEKPQLEIVSAKEGMNECLANLQSSTAQTTSLPTGFSSLDSAMMGLKRGSVLIVGARPGIGKTSFCVQVVTSLAQTGSSILYFSTEMTPSELSEKQLAQTCPVDAFLLESKQLPKDTLSMAQISCDTLSQLSFHTVRAFQPSLEMVREGIEQINPDVVVFDHIQHISSAHQYEEIDRFIKGLKALALEKNIAVVVCSQLSRRHEIEGRLPELVDLKECGTLEEEASVVLLMHDSQKKGNRPILFRVAKNRHGRTGDTTLLFECNYTRFQDMGVQIQ